MFFYEPNSSLLFVQKLVTTVILASVLQLSEDAGVFYIPE